MNKAVINAPAKINLFLEVTDRRPDGYHNIISVIKSLPDLADTVTVLARCDGEIHLTCSDSAVPLDRTNTAYKAAERFFDIYAKGGGADIDIVKRIPIAAGLAGGSADAAAVINGLDLIYKTRLTTEEKRRLAAFIGADVPFCIDGGINICRGIGEELFSCAPLAPCYIIVSVGSECVSTAEAYRTIDRIRDRVPLRNEDTLVSALGCGSLRDVCRSLYNVFEYTTDAHIKIRRILDGCGATGSLMSGSGPSVFGIFDDLHAANAACAKLAAAGYFVCLCRCEG